MKRTPISYALLVLMFVPFLVGRFYYFHDIYTIPFVLAAVWVLTLNRKRTGWATAVALAGAGVL